MTFKEEITSNECKSTKEDDFESKLHEEFKALEKDYNGIKQVLEKLNKDLGVVKDD